jgi:hypothetical protein
LQAEAALQQRGAAGDGGAAASAAVRRLAELLVRDEGAAAELLQAVSQAMQREKGESQQQQVQQPPPVQQQPQPQGQTGLPHQPALDLPVLNQPQQAQQPLASVWASLLPGGVHPQLELQPQQQQQQQQQPRQDPAPSPPAPRLPAPPAGPAQAGEQAPPPFPGSLRDQVASLLGAALRSPPERPLLGLPATAAGAAAQPLALPAQEAPLAPTALAAPLDAGMPALVLQLLAMQQAQQQAAAPAGSLAQHWPPPSLGHGSLHQQQLQQWQAGGAAAPAGLAGSVAAGPGGGGLAVQQAAGIGGRAGLGALDSQALALLAAALSPSGGGAPAQGGAPLPPAHAARSPRLGAPSVRQPRK